jgi:branched-subunit amino acid ABC-type transport system permease component
MAKEYQIYKGLQRPLVFKMFKGRFIYWGLGSLVGGIVAGIIVGSVVSSLAGLVAMLVVSFPLLMFTIEKQKKGLYDKKTDEAVFIISPHHHLRKF